MFSSRSSEIGGAETGFCDRGQSAGVTHGPLRVQSNWCAPGQGGLAGDAGRIVGASFAITAFCPRGRPASTYVSVKEAVLPFNRFPDDRLACLGPEMRSTGEVMGIDLNPRPWHFAKSQIVAGMVLPDGGNRSSCPLADRDKQLQVVETAQTSGRVGVHR